MNFEAKAREIVNDYYEHSGFFRTQSVADRFIIDIAQALKDAFEQGRKHGLEQAANVAYEQYAFDSWDDEDMASKVDQERNRVGCHIAANIRKLIEGGE